MVYHWSTKALQEVVKKSLCLANIHQRVSSILFSIWYKTEQPCFKAITAWLKEKTNSKKVIKLFKCLNFLQFLLTFFIFFKYIFMYIFLENKHKYSQKCNLWYFWKLKIYLFYLDRNYYLQIFWFETAELINLLKWLKIKICINFCVIEYKAVLNSIDDLE